MEAIVYSKPIVYGKPIVFKSNVVFPSVSNNFRRTQLTWQYHHRRLGFMCYHHHHHHHHHHSRADEQLKLVAFNETPATQIVKPTPKPKPKPKLKLRLVEKLLIGALAVCGLGIALVGFVVMPKETVLVGSPCQFSMPCEVICSKLEQEDERMFIFLLLSSFCSFGLIIIPSLHEEFNESEYEKRLALKILGAIFMLGFVLFSIEFMSISYTMDTLIDIIFLDRNWPLNLSRAIFMVSSHICCLGFIVVHDHYEKVDENDSEKGLDLKVFGAISMGVDVACSPEFLSIAYTMDTLSHTVFRNWHWPYNINLALFFILLHICCRGLRAVIDLHHKHSRLPGCEKNSFNKRPSKQTTRLRKKSSRRRTNQQKKDLEKTTPVVEVFLQEPTHRSSNLCNGLQEI